MEALILGRPYRLTLARVKRQKTTVRGKEYGRLTVSIPREDLEWILRGDKEAYAIAFLARASTINLLNFDTTNDPLWKALPKEAKIELYYHGLAPQKPKGRIVLIAAEEDEVRSLGLDPDKPITLKDLVEAARSRLATSAPAKDGNNREAKEAPTETLPKPAT